VVAFRKPRPYEDGCGVGHVFSLHSSTENFGGGRRWGRSGRTRARGSAGGEVLDRTDVVIGLGQSLVEEPLERITLDCYEIRSCKASLMLANETRSGLRDREDNGQLLQWLAAGGSVLHLG